MKKIALACALLLTGCETLEGLSNVGQQIAEPNHTVVFLGDSYAAGEGNPDQRLDQRGQVRWSSFRCHRSGSNGRLDAVDLLDTRPESLAVTINATDVSCSGATINEGILGSYRGVVGQNQAPPPLAPQIDQVRSWMDLENITQIDALVISVGGNDIGFSDVVAACLNGVDQSCRLSRELDRIINDGDPGTDVVNDNDPGRPELVGFNNLKAAFRSLKASIDDRLSPSQVILVGYTDPLRDHNAAFCNKFDDNFAVRPEQFKEGELVETTLIERFLNINAQMRHIDRSESEFVYNSVVSRINSTLREIAEDEEFGWTFVDVEGLMRRHGYCAREPWVNSLKASLTRQGDFNGTAHPNDLGYLAYRAAIIAALAETLDLDQAPDPFIREDGPPVAINATGRELEIVAGEGEAAGTAPTWRGLAGTPYRLQGMLYPSAKDVTDVELEFSINHPIDEAFAIQNSTRRDAERYSRFGFENVHFADIPEAADLQVCDWIYYRWRVDHTGRGPAGTAFSDVYSVQITSNAGVTSLCTPPD